MALAVDNSDGVYFDAVSVSEVDKKIQFNDYSKKRDWDKCLIDVSQAKVNKYCRNRFGNDQVFYHNQNIFLLETS